MEKMTKTQILEAIKEACSDKAEIVEFCDKEIAALANKAAKAKAKAAEKKVAGDELRAEIESLITDELQTVDEVLAQLHGEEVTKAKVINRLGQLVRLGSIVKEEIKTEDGKKKMAYKKAE